MFYPYKKFFYLFLIEVLLISPIHAKPTTNTTENTTNEPQITSRHSKIEWTAVVGDLVGGLSLFLYGIKVMSKSLKILAGDRLKELLSSISSNQFTGKQLCTCNNLNTTIGMVAGTLVTVMLQSSALVSVMLIEFVNGGLMSFNQTIGVLLGSGIGSTSATQLMAFNIRKYSLYLITIGFVIMTANKSNRYQQSGLAILGLGLVFLGSDVLSRFVLPLENFPPFLNALASMSTYPLLALLASMLFTALVQSSSATLGVVIVLAGQNLITIESGIVMVLGSNIGTGMSGLIAALSGEGNKASRKEALRVAVANILMKAVGAIILIPFSRIFIGIVTYCSPKEDLSRQIANAHTLFNIFLAIVFLPFCGQIAKIIHVLIPERMYKRDVLRV
jgi:phosphate:Na+ symporter